MNLENILFIIYGFAIGVLTNLIRLTPKIDKVINTLKKIAEDRKIEMHEIIALVILTYCLKEGKDIKEFLEKVKSVINDKYSCSHT
ncbi:MAG: hypothetical protein QW511_03600 [Candidatus Methanomethylicia archaeon]